MNNALSPREMDHGPWVDIDLAALCANYAMIDSLAAGAETAAVVKCDAYGLGMAEIATTLAAKANCKTFFVAYAHKGAELRAVLGESDSNIYIFNGLTPENAPLFQRARLRPVLNSLAQAELWVREFPGTPAALHVDTGMNRLGAPLGEVDAIASLKGLQIDLVERHATGALSDDPGRRDQVGALAHAVGV